ncbi:MAG: twitching motility protein PilT [Lachnospiraceae bacterium]|nr:twitching motility protein PilT [Lachnospiraceae bacterium]
MVEIISGEKGKGKTKRLLDRVRGDVKNAQGSIVFLDKNQKHMYELDSKVRLINMADYDVESSDEFLGFLSGVISQNNDIEEIFLDSFLTIGYIDTSEGLVRAIEKLDELSEKFETNFVLSVSKDEKELPDAVKPKVVISL